MYIYLNLTTGITVILNKTIEANTQKSQVTGKGSKTAIGELCICLVLLLISVRLAVPAEKMQGV